ncbi:Uncharacterised protein [uncultured archaeon]|nr:Uncharacterised protein [uncultured archaeon]
MNTVIEECSFRVIEELGVVYHYYRHICGQRNRGISDEGEGLIILELDAILGQTHKLQIAQPAALKEPGIRLIADLKDPINLSESEVFAPHGIGQMNQKNWHVIDLVDIGASNAHHGSIYWLSILEKNEVHHIVLLGDACHRQYIAVHKRQCGVLGQNMGIFSIQEHPSKLPLSQDTDIIGYRIFQIASQIGLAQEGHGLIASPGLVLELPGPCLGGVDNMAFLCRPFIHIYAQLLSALAFILVVVEPAKVIRTPDSVAITEMTTHKGCLNRLLGAGIKEKNEK